MITGSVVAGREAIIPVSLLGTNGRVEPIDAILDTGFTGFLTLPLPQIARLGFPYEGIIHARLGDGREVELDMFVGMVLWEGQAREALLLAAEGKALVGMALLAGYRVTLDVAPGGLVMIDRLL
jgi:predicted aspartyl protease